MSPAPLLTPPVKISRNQARSIKRRAQIKLLQKFQKESQAGDKSVWTRLGNRTNANCIALKELLRDRLKSRQEPRCCYCKRWLLNTAYASPIEHVLPRSIYPQFAVSARNLAIACYDCNDLKKKDDWGGFSGSPILYPGAEAATHFFHPRYHRFDDHIRYMRVESNRLKYVSYRGLTAQGRHLCVNLLSRVVGRESLQRSTPGLTDWLQVVDSLKAEPHPPYRPALEAFRIAIDQAVDERVKDGDRAGLLWAHA